MIGILSDTHDNLTRVREAVRLFNDAGCDLVIHAGDFVAPFAAEELRNLRRPGQGRLRQLRRREGRPGPGLPGARGDPGARPSGSAMPAAASCVCHLDAAVGGTPPEKACDIVVFGHTHRPLVEAREGVLLINPGEAGGWLTGGKAPVALLDPAALDRRHHHSLEVRHAAPQSTAARSPPGSSPARLPGPRPGPAGGDSPKRGSPAARSRPSAQAQIAGAFSAPYIDLKALLGYTYASFRTIEDLSNSCAEKFF